MRLNLVEFLVMTNPVRGMIHRYFEARQLERIAGTTIRCGKTLEIGCGSGIGAAIILDRFRADRVDAFVLAQGSMERSAPVVAEKTGKPVLSSPGPCIEHVVELLKG